MVRPSTIYQVVVSLLEASPPSRVRAALSRDGVEVYGDHVNMQPMETRAILLQVQFVLSRYFDYKDSAIPLLPNFASLFSY